MSDCTAARFVRSSAAVCDSMDRESAAMWGLGRFGGRARAQGTLTERVTCFRAPGLRAGSHHQTRLLAGAERAQLRCSALSILAWQESIATLRGDLARGPLEQASTLACVSTPVPTTGRCYPDSTRHQCDHLHAQGAKGQATPSVMARGGGRCHYSLVRRMALDGTRQQRTVACACVYLWSIVCVYMCVCVSISVCVCVCRSWIMLQMSGGLAW